MDKKQLIFNGITADSRKVKPGYVFVAIKGEKQNGHDYIEEAIKNGANLIVSEKDMKYQDIPYLQVLDARQSLANMSSLFYSLPKDEIKVIGITGTNGKTTTSHMIHKIFLEGEKDIALINNKILTTPSHEEICKNLYHSLQKGKKYAVMEVSSHGLKQKRVEGIDFDTAIFTNISHDHLDYHETFEDYFQSKKILFQRLKDNKRAIINGDDPFSLKLLEGKKNIYVITYGLNPKSTITASSINAGESIAFNYCLQRSLDSYKKNKIDIQEFPIEINLLGYHNIYNTLAAITTGLIYEIPIDVIQRALKKIKPVSRRLEYLEMPPYKILDDYAHNPSSFQAAFEILQNIDYDNVFVIISIRGNRGKEINKQNAETIANWCSLLDINKLYITSSEDIVKEKDKVKPEEKKAFLKVLKEKKISSNFDGSLKKTIDKVIHRVRDNDLIMLLGAQGMDEGKNIIKTILEEK